MNDVIKKLEILYRELSRIKAEIVFLENQNEDVNDSIFNYIVKIVCEKENIIYNDLISSSKKQNLAFSRMMISKLTHENTGFNLSKIGKLLGNRDHSTVIYGIKTVNNSLRLKDNTFPNYKHYEQNVKDYRDNLFNQKRSSNTTINE
jgi:chromosomal replication initiation ATPase DnaA